MRKGLFFFSLFVMFLTPVMAAKYVPKQFANTATGEGLYPYSLNNRNNLPKTNDYVAPIGSGTKPMQQSGKRGVVKRPVRARAASTAAPTTSIGSRRVVQRNNVGRSAMNTRTVSQNTTRKTDNRGVVARGASVTSQARTANVRRSTTSTNTTSMSAQKCFAGYKECMDMYCKHEDLAYNRCYCSAKLAQIDSKYQSDIDDLIEKIVRLQNKFVLPEGEEPLDPEDLETYWEQTMLKYTGENAWLNLNTSLQQVFDNLEWADTETRVRGQNAFNIGHQYCVNYLQACNYMASNLRDAYKTEITRDCAAYEDTLKKIKTAAESVVKHYGD